jgi:hypothetical protein
VLGLQRGATMPSNILYIKYIFNTYRYFYSKYYKQLKSPPEPGLEVSFSGAINCLTYLFMGLILLICENDIIQCNLMRISWTLSTVYPVLCWLLRTSKEIIDAKLLCNVLNTILNVALHNKESY